MYNRSPSENKARKSINYGKANNREGEERRIWEDQNQTKKYIDIILKSSNELNLVIALASSATK
jgi:hypothetical protein